MPFTRFYLYAAASLRSKLGSNAFGVAVVSSRNSYLTRKSNALSAGCECGRIPACAVHAFRSAQRTPPRRHAVQLHAYILYSIVPVYWTVLFRIVVGGFRQSITRFSIEYLAG
jgi:hypothetical protein